MKRPHHRSGKGRAPAGSRHASPDRAPAELLEGLVIEAVEYGGHGVGRHAGRVVAVPGTAPGDVVDCRVRAEPDGHLEGTLVRIVAPGPRRRTPSCPHLERCGGCQLMHLDDAAQLESKRAFVQAALARAGVTAPAVAPVRAAASVEGYRRRTLWHGLYGPGGVRFGLFHNQSQRIVDLPDCRVLHPELNVALESVRGAIAHLVEGAGSFRVEAVCDATERVGLVLFIPRDAIDGFAEVARAMIETGVVAVRIVDEHDSTLLEEGDPRQFVLRTEAAGAARHEVRYSLQSFTQLNFEQNSALVEHVLASAREAGARRVLDLYSGIGNYAVTLAAEADEVLAVESSMSSVADSRDNAARLGRSNLRCVRSASSSAVRELVRRGERFDFVVLNPTRAGADGVVGSLARLGAARICYVSCSPPTLARDLAVLQRAGYRLTSVTPFDMFPQTYHVETIAVLDRIVRQR